MAKRYPDTHQNSEDASKDAKKPKTQGRHLSYDKESRACEKEIKKEVENEAKNEQIKYNGKGPIQGKMRLTKNNKIRIIWRNSYYVKIYIFAKQGMSDHEISKAIGYDYTSFIKRIQKDPGVLFALREGRRPLSEGSNSFRDYVFERLPPALKEIWEEINRNERIPTPGHTMIVDDFFQKAGTRAQQHMWLYALVHHNFHLGKACQAVNISHNIYYRWMQDKEFATLIKEIHWHKQNFFENALIDLVKAGDVPTIIFANRTFNADRGYGDKTKVEVSGNIQVNHTMVLVDDLDLPLDLKLEILNAVKKRQAIIDKKPEPRLIEDVSFGEFPVPQANAGRLPDENSEEGLNGQDGASTGGESLARKQARETKWAEKENK